MLEKNEGGWWISCDKCSDSHDLDVPDGAHFNEVLEQVREAGFRTERNEAAQEWEHTCLACQEEGSDVRH